MYTPTAHGELSPPPCTSNSTDLMNNTSSPDRKNITGAEQVLQSAEISFRAEMVSLLITPRDRSLINSSFDNWLIIKVICQKPYTQSNFWLMNLLRFSHLHSFSIWIFAFCNLHNGLFFLFSLIKQEMQTAGLCFYTCSNTTKYSKSIT